MNSTPRARHVARFPRRRAIVESLERRELLSADLLTYRNGPADLGLNSNETALTPANVNANDFGKLRSTPVDGQVYAQPLYVAQENITSGNQPGLHDVVYVATEHDSLYAIDAHDGQVLWRKSFIDPAHGVASASSHDVSTQSIFPEIGITSTPVIDPSTNTLYADALTEEIIGGQTHFIHRLHALDLRDGSEKLAGPRVLGDTALHADGSYLYLSGPAVNGTGADSVNGVVTFNAKIQLQRVALSLIDGVVYVGFSSYSDNANYHGWIMGVDARTMTTVAAFDDTPNGAAGGIWQSGGGIASDASGNLYVSTGNGTFDGTLDGANFPAQHDFGDSVLKLVVDPASSPTHQNGNGWGLKVVDYFSPYNNQVLNAHDSDLGSGAALLLPDSAGSVSRPHLLLTGSKDGTIFLLDRDNLGKFNPQADQIVQGVFGLIPSEFGPPGYFNGNFYFTGFNDKLKSFSVSNAALSGVTSTSPDGYKSPGAISTISSNGNAVGIIWQLEHDTSELRAYDATNVARELYTSSQAPTGRDQLGGAIKFSVPTVADGQVFVGTADSLVTYGLLNPSTAQPPPRFNTPNERYVAAAFRDVLHREVDAGALAYWSTQLDQGVSAILFANALTHSDEYFRELIQSAYLRFLGRAADSQGMLSWAQAMRVGLTDERLEAAFVGSPEFYAHSGATDLAWVDAMYQELLGRAADAEGTRGWVQALAQGLPRAAIAYDFTASPEREQVRVQGDYQYFLGRTAADAEIAFWVNALQQGWTHESVTSGFVASDEYFKEHAA